MTVGRREDYYFFCRAHPRRAVSCRGDECWECRSYRERLYGRLGIVGVSGLWPWILSLGAMILLGMAVSMALAEHVHVEMFRRGVEVVR